jgi:hypothetical protein
LLLLVGLVSKDRNERGISDLANCIPLFNVVIPGSDSGKDVRGLPGLNNNLSGVK